jgi:hypothetical protein
MIKRFQGSTGRGALIAALREQKIVAGDVVLAEAIVLLANVEQVEMMRVAHIP